MNRHLNSLWMALVFGLIWSLAWSLSLAILPPGPSGQRIYGALLALTGAVLAILTAHRQNFSWTHILYALALIGLFGAAEVGTPVRIIGSAAVLGWVRTAGRYRRGLTLPVTAELFSGAGSIGLALGFNPTSAIVIGLGTWLFYLLQIVPLAVSGDCEWPARAEVLQRRFEATRQRVENILAARL